MAATKTWSKRDSADLNNGGLEHPALFKFTSVDDDLHKQWNL